MLLVLLDCFFMMICVVICSFSNLMWEIILIVLLFCCSVSNVEIVKSRVSESSELKPSSMNKDLMWTFLFVMSERFRVSVRLVRKLSFLDRLFIGWIVLV